MASPFILLMEEIIPATGKVKLRYLIMANGMVYAVMVGAQLTQRLFVIHSVSGKYCNKSD